MNRGKITPPFFEVGPKAYAWGDDVVALARRADELSRAWGVAVIFTPQYVDIPAVAAAVDLVHVFAQHMDALEPGRGIGAVLPEAIRAAGATGVLLNHVERRLPRDVLERTIHRAQAVGLSTMVCADDVEDAVTIARLAPDIVIVEEPLMIAGGKRSQAARDSIAATNAAIRRVNPAIRVLHGAGINGPDDVYDVIASGAEGTGSSSAIFTAGDQSAVLETMIRATRQAWDSRQTMEDR
ncbi:MAG: triose-phosphate isomerase [Chloroflexota bacterium]